MIPRTEPCGTPLLITLYSKSLMMFTFHSKKFSLIYRTKYFKIIQFTKILLCLHFISEQCKKALTSHKIDKFLILHYFSLLIWLHIIDLYNCVARHYCLIAGVAGSRSFIMVDLVTYYTLTHIRAHIHTTHIQTLALCIL